MKRPLTLWAAALLLAGVSAATVGCHYDRDTAGRPDAEQGNGLDGSVTATKAGTGDPKVGAGRGQVGTDAPPKPGSVDKGDSAAAGVPVEPTQPAH